MSERTLIEETLEKINRKVILAGWVNTVRNHGRIIFVDLRDRDGLIQVIFGGKLAKEAKKLRPEWVIKIEGLVKKRPEKLINPDLPTGTIEVEAQSLTILSQSDELPFDLGKKSSM